jgi:hypothetical protein
MAGERSMTAADVVAQSMSSEHGDLLREAVRLIARELMEAEVAEHVGAEYRQVSEDRVSQRNGYRPRVWETRVGEIELLVPKARSGPAYFPSFLEPRRRCEQAIVAVVMEAYVNGVSTRKVDRLVEQLGIQGMDKDRVSRLCRALDEHVDEFRSRRLDGAYPYLEDVRIAAEVPRRSGHPPRAARAPRAAARRPHGETAPVRGSGFSARQTPSFHAMTAQAIRCPEKRGNSTANYGCPLAGPSRGSHGGSYS